MKNIDNEIQAAQTRIEQLNHRKDRLTSKLKVEERKKRTKRLIERGAILENVISNATDFSNEQIQALLIDIFSSGNVKSKIEQIRGQDANNGNPLS